MLLVYVSFLLIREKICQKYWPCKSIATYGHKKIHFNQGGVVCYDCGASWHYEYFASIAGNGDPLISLVRND